MQQAVYKLQRLLGEYHLLCNCQEVSMKELADCLPGSRKTFSRDLKLLRQAGAPIRYEREKRVFWLEREGLEPPVLPDSPAQARALHRLRRLMRLMDELPLQGCDRWYQEQFPGACRRTMQRDFALLCSIGYRVKYETEAFNCHDAGMDQPAGQYYCDRPMGTYELPIFKEM